MMIESLEYPAPKDVSPALFGGNTGPPRTPGRFAPGSSVEKGTVEAQ